MNCVRIRVLSGPYFPSFGLSIRSEPEIQTQENTDQKIFEYGHFLYNGVHRKCENVVWHFTIITVKAGDNIKSSAYSGISVDISVINSIVTEVPVIQKPVHRFTLQVNGLVSMRLGPPS